MFLTSEWKSGRYSVGTFRSIKSLERKHSRAKERSIQILLSITSVGQSSLIQSRNLQIKSKEWARMKWKTSSKSKSTFIGPSQMSYCSVHQLYKRWWYEFSLSGQWDIQRWLTSKVSMTLQRHWFSHSSKEPFIFNRIRKIRGKLHKKSRRNTGHFKMNSKPSPRKRSLPYLQKSSWQLKQTYFGAWASLLKMSKIILWMSSRASTRCSRKWKQSSSNRITKSWRTSMSLRLTSWTLLTDGSTAIWPESLTYTRTWECGIPTLPKKMASHRSIAMFVQPCFWSSLLF